MNSKQELAPSTRLPTRSLTTDAAQSDPHNHPPRHARSEDLNHTQPRPDSPESTPYPSGSSPNRLSVASFSSVSSSSSITRPPNTSTSTSASLVSASCSSCGKAMQGPFVRALGTVFHLNCFKCMDCSDVVASKFFPIEGPDGKQQPLCERDYFRRLNLICAKCGMALRGSYITACNKKFHVEHFTCSLCPTLFGPQDSYYEHEGDVYCHFHYSTRFATKCAGCSSAILKQFVEINRNMRDECWHPECYMINKFWNVKVVSRRPASLEGEHEVPAYVEEEQRETPVSLKEKQVRMEQQVYRIWTVLSAFEESSAACISDMLRQVSNGQYLDAIRMAEKFILHVEVLFATIDDLEYQFAKLNMKGMSHVREARMLCRKTVELFTLLSHTQETGSRRMGMTQELLALVTGLAHYLKILIRIALTGALKLERERPPHLREGDAMGGFLDKLHLLAVQGGNPTARRMIKGQNGEHIGVVSGSGSATGNSGTQGVTYGFRSLAPENAGESPFSVGAGSSGGLDENGHGQVSSSHPPSDLCVKCGLTVEEDCVRLGTYQRWHSQCVGCKVCGKVAAVPLPAKDKEKEREASGDGLSAPSQPPKLSTARRPPANVGQFVYEADSMKETPSFGLVPTVILCTEHAHGGCRSGFKAVQRLEQYAFLLNVALRRLYLLLRRQGVVPSSPEAASTPTQASSDPDPYRNSADIRMMKQVHLDRKLSATARLPKRSTIVESPAGRSVAPSDVLHSQKSQDINAAHHPHHHQGHVHEAQHAVQTKSPPIPNQTPAYVQHQRPYPHLETSQASLSPQSQVIRPAFARNNTEVMIVDDSAPNSPAIGSDEARDGMMDMPPDESITLADIPQLMEAAQAREQQRSLPRLNQIPCIAELSALELAIVKYSAVLVLIKSPLKDMIDIEELLEMVEAKKTGFWKALLGRGDKKNTKKKPGVFGVPLEVLVAQEGVDSLLGASRATLRVPSFIDDVISAMRQMDMSVEGIFRKNGNIRRLNELREAIDRDPSSVDLTQDNPVQLAALLKKFLRDLPEPLMTFKLHRLLIASQALPNEADRKRMLHMLSIIMPKAHRDTMEVLFVFLKWVASFAHMDEETGSKMDLSNLAITICPSILYSSRRDAVRDESFGAIRVITALLENQDEFFAVPEEFMPILHDQEYFVNSMELPAKDFMKKCDTYQKVKATNGRLPGAMYNVPNSSTPRFPQPTSPVLVDKPSAPPNPNLRPSHPGLVQPVPSYAGSPSTPQGIVSGGSPRPEEWPPVQRPLTAPGSRPSSYVQPRPSQDYPNHNGNNHIPNPNGYPAALRPRT
ncbi:Rho-type GTPase activating protein Rga1 [Stygiomarasmius scandens]|uniref:Rho-type GTPase activating protein Rga1 n=1 Tax=Marasmiellus scandens TaxID=2682957 RepID=A0ABR1IZQ3_9AGAR